MNNENIEKKHGKITCDMCGNPVSRNFLYRHFVEEHGMTKHDAMGHQMHLSSFFYMIPSSVLSDVFCLTNAEPKDILNTSCIRKFKSFYNNVVGIRPYRTTDTRNFVENVLPWKEQHPKLGNSKELCRLMFPNEPENEKKMYQKMLDANPYYKHDGRLSPFSKDFAGYRGMTDEEKEKAVLAATQFDRDDRCPNQIAYWTSRGFTEEEAKEKVHERQITFSLDTCIEKYGKAEGKRRWAERQKKWLDSYKKQNFSNVSQELFWPVYERIKDKVSGIYFATLDQDTGDRETGNANNEYRLTIGDKSIKPDFFVLSEKKIIEFDGDYWHSKKARGNQLRDAERDELIRSGGYEIHHVAEWYYKGDRDKTVGECVKFILGDRNGEENT